MGRLRDDEHETSSATRSVVATTASASDAADAAMKSISSSSIVLGLLCPARCISISESVRHRQRDRHNRGKVKENRQLRHEQFNPSIVSFRRRSVDACPGSPVLPVLSWRSEQE